MVRRAGLKASWNATRTGRRQRGTSAEEAQLPASRRGNRIVRGMEPAPELVSLMERMFRNFDAHDGDAVVDAFSREPGSLAIGSDPDEWWEGYEALAAMWRVQLQELEATGIKPQIDILKLVAWKESTVGRDRSV